MVTYTFTMPEHAYVRLGPLSMNVCTAKTITDASVAEYMDRTLSAARGVPTVVSLTYYLHEVPNARQRQAMVDALTRHGAAMPRRTALLTDSALMRGALTAFRWLTRSETDSFALADRRVAIRWLRERAEFDPDEALRLFEACCREVGVSLPKPSGADAR